MAAGLGLIAYAGLSNGDVWKEFYQYFRQSRFVSSYFIYTSLFSCPHNSPIDTFKLRIRLLALSKNLVIYMYVFSADTCHFH